MNKDILNRPGNPALDIVIQKSKQSVEDAYAYCCRGWYHAMIGWFAHLWDALVMFLVNHWPVSQSDYSQLQWPIGRSGYQPYAPIEHGPPPRSASAIIPVRSIFQQMDDLLDRFLMRSSGDISDYYFALSPEQYHNFYHQSILQWRFVGDRGNLRYRTIPVVEQDDVPGGIALTLCGGQSNTALLALMKTIEAGIAQRHETTLPSSYLATIEDEPVISDGQSADNGKCRPVDYDARLISRVE